MPNTPAQDLSKYRVDRAEELYKDATNLFENGSFKSSNNRAYYCIFYAMRAILALDEQDFKKHSGVIQYFQKNYIKAGLFDKKYSNIIMNASTIRNASDYDDFYIASKDEAKNQIKEARLFLDAVIDYLATQQAINPRD